MQDKIYIHYGHDRFDPNLFHHIQNEHNWVKPKGGLWASPVNAKLGWKDWCKIEEFRECIEENSFKFTLPGANIFVIDSVEKLNALPSLGLNCIRKLIDFEKCIELGYDAIELNLSSDHQLYWELYGWDCDSIIVMNPDKIKMDSRKLQTL
mgnify:CR=1 FL=1